MHPSTRSPSHSYRNHKPKRRSIDSLPGYYSSIYSHSLSPEPASDRPPDYPDSADEADLEDEEEEAYHSPKRSHFLGRTSSRHRQHRFTPQPQPPSGPFYNSQPSTISDTHLDSLLARSIHALEMSNALLQTSNSHQQSKSLHHSSPRYDYHIDHHRIPHRQRKSTRQKKRMSRDPWMEKLSELADSVDELFGDETRMRNPSNNGQGISTSLPSTEFYMPSPKVTPSSSSQLKFGYNEPVFRSPPPQQMTQHTSAESSNGSNHFASDPVHLPSTTGFRSRGLVTQFPSPPHRRINRRSYSHDMTPTQLPSSSAGTSPAQSLLSQLGGRPKRSSSFQSYASHVSSDGSKTIGRGRIIQSPSSHDSSSSRRSMSPLPNLEIRPMTPPIEEITPPSSESSTPAASQALERLRKILQDAPETSKKPRHLPPTLIANSRSSLSIPQESNTTASISRLLTRGTHRSSTSAPPPKQSSLKVPSSPMLSSGQVTPISSGRSTPKHKVQFAELPESYSSSKPGSKTKSSNKGKKSDTGWWKAFWGAADFAGYTSPTGKGPRFEDRFDDRVARSWGRPPFGAGGFDEWSIQ